MKIKIPAVVFRFRTLLEYSPARATAGYPVKLSKSELYGNTMVR